MQLPLKITRYAESFIVRDDLGLSICTVHFEDDPNRASVTKRLSAKEAEAVVKHIARALGDGATEKPAATLNQHSASG